MMNRVVHFFRKYARMTGLLLLTITSFIFAMFQGGFLSWFLFYTFLPFALYSFTLIGYSLDKFKVERMISKSQYQAGDHLEARIIISRKSLMPLFYLMVEDEIPDSLLPLAQQKKKIIVFPLLKREIKLNYRFDHLPRGEHFLETIRLQTGDFFGLYQKTSIYTVPQTIIVYPAIIQLPFQQLEKAYDQGNGGSIRKLLHDHTLASGVRDYQPGDQISWINWKATAKKNEMMTKEFDEQKSHDLFLILDEQQTPLFEEMVVFTASFSHAVLKKGIQMGYLGSAFQEPFLPIRGGEHQRQDILYKLARTKASAVERLEVSLENHQSILPLNAALIIVTGKLSRTTIEFIAGYKLNRAVTVFCMKNGSFLTAEEIAVRESAKKKGIRVDYLDQHQYESEIIEVAAQ